MSRISPAVTVTLASLLSLSCGESATAPAPELQATPAIVTTQERDVWDITWVSSCGLGQFPPGTYTIHLTTRTTSLSGQPVTTSQTFNGHGTLVDIYGNKYSLVQVTKYVQKLLQTDPNGPYTVTVDAKYMVVSRGRLPNEFVEVSLQLQWTGTDFIITSAYVPTCR